MDRPRRERPQIREEDLPNLAEILAQEQPDVELVDAQAAPPPQPRSRKALLLSFVALGIAALAVLAAILASGKKTDEPKPPPRVAIKPEGRPEAKKEPEVQVPALAPEVLRARVAAHLGRAKRHLRAGKLRSAQFFLDQVLILDPGHAEAKALMAKLEAKVEERAKLAAAAAEAAAARRARRAAASRRQVAAAKKTKPKEEPKKVAVAKQPEEEEPKKPPPKPAAKPAAQSKSGELVIRSRPDSLVHLDGVPLGSTPMTEVKLAPGRHAVRLRVGGYEPYFKEFDLKPGEQLVLDVQLKPEAELPKKGK
jgi:hypothetical protein